MNEEIDESAAMAVDRANKMLKLTNDPLFVELITQGYIRDTALNVGTNFDDSGIDALKAITHLKYYVATVIDDGKLAKEMN